MVVAHFPRVLLPGSVDQIVPNTGVNLGWFHRLCNLRLFQFDRPAIYECKMVEICGSIGV